MDHPRHQEATHDLSALAWVQDELRRSLDAAHKALRRFVKEAEALAGSDVDVVDPSVLRTARQQIHQGVGALELVGLPAAATVLRACEAAVQRYVAKPHKLTQGIVDDLEHASFALLDYIARMLAGRQVSPLAMFPQYRKVQEDAGADRVHPADLWSVDWRWRDLPDVGAPVPRQPDAATRSALEQQMLAMMRAPTPAAAARMSELCAGLGAGAAQRPSATLWKLAAGVFEAQAAGLLAPDVFVKRVASRLLAQLRIVERGEGDVSERLAQDLLFFCAQAGEPPAGVSAPRLAAARKAYALQTHRAVDYATPHLGQYDPAWVAQARKRVGAAKDSWSAVAGAELHRLAGLAEQFSLVGDSLKRLFPQGTTMADELQHAVALTQQQQAAPGTALAMEVATSLLYVEAALEDADFDDPGQGARVERLAHRIAAVRQGAAPEPLEAWMEELYRRVSDRQTMGSVVQELRASLSEAEKLIDQYFRNPAERTVLIPVPNQLSAMRGVLSVLGMDAAAAALARMRDEVEGMIETEVDPQRVGQSGVFERLAGNLGALGFLIDMLSVQPHLAKSLFVFDPEAGTLSPLMGRAAPQVPSVHTAPAPLPVEPGLVQQVQHLADRAVREDVPVEELARGLERLSQQARAADQPALTAAVAQAQVALAQAQDADALDSVRGQLSETLGDFAVAAAVPPLPEPTPAVAPSSAPVPATSDLAEDDEMREIFLEEAREVVGNANAACAELADAPSDLAQMTAVRRAFHTLKGSSRMVGLKAFGDAAWACEQLYNTRLADQRPADAPLLAFTRAALDELGAWVDDIAAHRDGARTPQPIEAAVEALKSGAAAPAAPGTGAAPTPDVALPAVAVAAATAVDIDDAPAIDVAPPPSADAPDLADALPAVAWPTGLGLVEAPGAGVAEAPEGPDALAEASASHGALAEAPALHAALAEAPAWVDAPALADGPARAEPPALGEPLPADDGAILATAEWPAHASLDAVAAPPDPSADLSMPEFLRSPLASPELRADPALPTAEPDPAALSEAEALAAFGLAPFEAEAPAEAPVEPAFPAPAAASPVPFGFPADLPTPDDLELRLPTPAPMAPRALDAEPAFTLDLSAFDDVPGAPAASDAPPATEEAPQAGADAWLAAPAAAGVFDAAAAPADDLAGLLDGLDLGLDPAPAAGSADALAPLALEGGWNDVPAEAPAFPDAVPHAAAVEDAPPARDEAPDEEQVKVVGGLRISIPLFNIYLNEADELSRRLTTELAEWGLELHRPVGEMAVALAHSLAGSSATVGFADLSHLARTLEHALMRTQAIGQGTPDEAALFIETSEEIRRLLHQFAAGFLKQPPPALLQRLAAHEITSARRLAEVTAEDAMSTDGDDAHGPTPSSWAALPSRHAALRADDAVAAFEPALDERAWDAPAADAPSPEPVVEATSAEPGHAAHEAAGATAIDAPHEAAALGSHAPTPADAFAAHDFEQDSAHDMAQDVAQDIAQDIAQDAAVGDAPGPVPDAAAPGVAAAPAHDAPALARADAEFAALGAPAFRPLEAAAPTPTAVTARAPLHGDDDIDAVDAVDAELFPIFEEEGQELLPKFEAQLRDWVRRPSDTTHASACMRTLHTLKGGARLAGAMRLGEMAHRLETAVEALAREEAPTAAAIEALQNRADALSQTFEALRSRDAAAYAAAVATIDAAVSATPETPAADLVPVSLEIAPIGAPVDAPAATQVDIALDALDRTDTADSTDAAPDPTDTPPADVPAAAPAAATTPVRPALPELPAIDWSRFTGPAAEARAAPAERTSGATAAVRVRAPLLDRLVNQAGEVSITRSRIEAEVGTFRGSLGDLADNLERLRQQLRDIELQAETQMSSRLEAAKAEGQSFDPLEFDRFTRFQELTRMMAESVNDVATVQRTLQRTLESTEDELAAQARLTRELQDDLLRTRMVEFEGLSDRLYRVVRQAAKETGKQVRLDIVGGSIEVDRGVLDRMTGAFEHLLRNAVTHGVEMPDARTAAGKPAGGAVVVTVTQEGNEVGVEFRDDGAGLDLERIRAKGRALGLIAEGREPADAELAQLIFQPGFTTAEQVTELAGRGVGMDVVRSEVNAMGGRIETATAAGQGTSFKLVVPLTTAVTQVVMLRVGDATVAVPSTLVEIVRRASVDEVERALASGTYAVGDRSLPFFWLGALLQLGPRSKESGGRTRHVVIIRSAQQRIALHVDEVLGNQEVVVKNLGPQLSRMPGLAGMTLLASGAVALIYNPVALATLYGAEARAATLASLQAPATPDEPAAAEPAQRLAPLVLVVDDSLTVRRVTQRLLVREGYRVALAKDGLDALERLAEERPAIVLSDIEMPRMDGFDLVRNMRGDARLRDLPVIMITSRIAQKHRDYAAELGVDHYLGKPYAEEDLLALIGRYTAAVALH